MLSGVEDPLTTLASAAIFSAPPPTSTVVGGAESQMKPETADTQQVNVLQSHLATVVFSLYVFFVRHATGPESLRPCTERDGQSGSEPPSVEADSLRMTLCTPSGACQKKKYGYCWFLFNQPVPG